LICDQLDEIDAIGEIHEDLTSHSSQNFVQGPQFCGKLLFDGHITLRSQQSPVSLASLEDSFHAQLSIWLAKELVNLNISLPCAVNFGPDDLVCDVHSCSLSILDTI
jgi:hypothetical protein